MSTFFLSIIVVGLSVFGLCINIIFKKDGKFPDKEVGHNEQMRKLGITCAKNQEKKMWSKKRKTRETASQGDVCSDCKTSCY